MKDTGKVIQEDKTWSKWKESYINKEEITYQFVVFQFLWINSIGVVNAAINLFDPNASGSIAV